jgi:uncharacterized protein
MPLRFFQALRAGGLNPGIGEYLSLLGALKAQLIEPNLTEFHTLSRMCLVKDETQFDRFDQIFADYLEGVERVMVDPIALPAEWLAKLAERELTPEEKAQIESLGSFEKLMETLRERLKEQQDRHQGGNRWIGTAGTSPFGNSGYNPEGVRIGGTGKQGRAAKVWEARQFRDFADNQELGVRDTKIALRKLRRFAREGAQFELDLDGTIRSTARNAGWLDVRMQRERHNAVKVLLLLDVGGSMDEHIYRVESLFSAVKSEFKHLEHYYFHNFTYERFWRENARRNQTQVSTAELMHKFDRSWKVIFVGDAAMSPYEVLSPGGSVEHWNEEAGEVWFKRLLQHFPRAAWLNPTSENHWHMTPSLQLIRQLLSERMYPLTLKGLDGAIDALTKGKSRLD